MSEERTDEEKKYERSMKIKLISFFAIGFLIIVLLFLSFKIGGLYTCAKSGGYLNYGVCVNLEDLGTCEYLGEVYAVDDGYDEVNDPPIFLG